MHLKRLIVAAIFLPAMYLYIMYLPPGFFLLLLMTVSLIALSEFYSMYRLSGILRHTCLFFGFAIIAVSYFLQELLTDAILFSIMAVMIIRLLFKKDPVSSLSDISVPVVGLLYISALLSFQVMIRKTGPEWIIFLYATVWASDSMAYYLGKGFGKRKLYREVSPNKTVAGAVGSVAGGAAGALLLEALMLDIGMTLAVSIGIMIGGLSIVGDLIESMFKRDAGVKDSGSLIPGHGGILDKIDGALFVGPALYWALKITAVIR